MTRLLERALRAAASAFLLFVLSGCGPGVGGTGTGAAPAEASFFGQVGAPAAGAVCQGQPCNAVALTLKDARVELVGACVRFVHEGNWPADANDLSVAGTVEVRGPSGTASSPGTLHLQFAGPGAASASQATVSLRDANGSLLLGPVVLARGDAGATVGPAGCGAP